MFQPLELFIGSRYLRAKRRNHFISFISLISVLGIALSIIVLITVLSVMNGFQHEVKAPDPGNDLTCDRTREPGTRRDWQGLQEKLKDNDEDQGICTLCAGAQGMGGVSGRRLTGAMLNGVDPRLKEMFRESASSCRT